MVRLVTKLGTLALKTFWEPIAYSLKKEAGYHPKFRQFVINLAQVKDRVTSSVDRRFYGRVTDVAIRPLNEEKTVEAAAELLAKFFAFTVAGAALTLEVQSSKSEARINEERKEEQRRQELQEIKTEVARHVQEIKTELASAIEPLAQKLEELKLLVTSPVSLDLKQTPACEDKKLRSH